MARKVLISGEVAHLAAFFRSDFERQLITEVSVTADPMDLEPEIGIGGDEEDRTPGLGVANAALSQLSYIPNL